MKRELLVLCSAGLLFTGIAAYSISYARAAVRDDLRKQDLTNIKRSLEQYYNAHEFYVTPPNGKTGCTENTQDSWFFSDNSPLLKEQFIDALPHDVRESKGFSYLYCVSAIKNNHTSGFYLEASLEANVDEGVFFDEDENRKFGYRVLLEHDKKIYRICGGEEQQCSLSTL